MRSDRWIPRCALVGLLVAGAGCHPEPATQAAAGPTGAGADKAEDAGAPPDICDPGAPTGAAFRGGGIGADGSLIIPGGRRVSPSGTSVTLGRASIGLALSADGRRAYVTNDDHRDEALQVVDLERGEVAQTLGGFKAYRGLAETPDGRLLVAAESEALDFGDGVDGVPGLGRILGHARRGVDVQPPPYAKGVDR